MLEKSLRVGVWGLGVVGESLIKYLHRQGFEYLLVHDSIVPNKIDLLKEYGAQWVADQSAFLKQCDLILPSPGIDLDPFAAYQSKFISELDLFYSDWHKPIVAITGSFGKTTVTSLLNNVFNQAGIKSVAAGNIGLAMCDVLGVNYELAILELSSFQLDLCRHFAPDVGVWTNFCPNHLDRHKTMERYFAAKIKMFLHQSAEQLALFPIELAPWLSEILLQSKIYFFSIDKIDQLPMGSSGVFYLNGEEVCLQTAEGELRVASLASFSSLSTYVSNLVIVAAVTYLRQMKLPNAVHFAPIEHRLEKFYTHNGVDFYNDSKSTVAETTLAAVQKLSGRPIILFLGGLSKGVDRSLLVAALRDKVKMVICFGSEGLQLHKMCQNVGIASQKFDDLQTATNYVLANLTNGDQVLFSPAGSSYDLFANYVQRGVMFKKLVRENYFC